MSFRDLFLFKYSGMHECFCANVNNNFSWLLLVAIFSKPTGFVPELVNILFNKSIFCLP